MTAGDRVYLSVLEHKVSEIERNCYEFRKVLRHYLDETGIETVEETEEKSGGLGSTSCNYAPAEAEGDSC